jgi:hypothetical protein
MYSLWEKRSQARLTINRLFHHQEEDGNPDSKVGPSLAAKKNAVHLEIPVN